MPKLERIYKEWKPRGLEIFAIGNDLSLNLGKSTSARKI